MLTEAQVIEMRRERMLLRSHHRRLAADIQRYGKLFPTPWIERQLGEWRADAAQTWARLQEIERTLPGA